LNRKRGDGRVSPRLFLDVHVIVELENLSIEGKLIDCEKGNPSLHIPKVLLLKCGSQIFLLRNWSVIKICSE